MAAFSMRALLCIETQKCINMQKNEKNCKKSIAFMYSGWYYHACQKKEPFQRLLG